MISNTCSRFALVAGGTPAVPVVKLTIVNVTESPVRSRNVFEMSLLIGQAEARALARA
jgi:hypothetical protein